MILLLVSLSGDVSEYDMDSGTPVQELQRRVQALMSRPEYIKLSLAGEILRPTSTLAESVVEHGS